MTADSRGRAAAMIGRACGGFASAPRVFRPAAGSGLKKSSAP
ncbi:hypothetical protein C4K05_2519 [Pseudomonas chlororaphis subsp. aureofaciens]|uniref:Uncharacterized protein n=1 Tax=Pseudomonas chlororaphis subsp. aureofaciens TaxID=587851 RepID=A0AAD0ZCL4_9PSED|nr:hypothetical protein C4K13_2461 [Pseudomonas chlororaphis subsp. aureofaciens]AZD98360.1 hypothetical protein C4K12_2494 [Pseudomonas chlororaphis subsp. aureofaciens]AZE29201.1 hypothetical protein C4K07_2416 [Pseudomonas chlororaphis subsp. aureofaciens]AZE35504.1 hypothetical protein C4K06_2471 [Pseudomonas chlororaphis subsp. aureofaciens]AZE41859.1 hypothetical protein C4K05_2519 [Pseudomonas chlororaphis subsp. aureofaciens]